MTSNPQPKYKSKRTSSFTRKNWTDIKEKSKITEKSSKNKRNKRKEAASPFSYRINRQTDLYRNKHKNDIEKAKHDNFVSRIGRYLNEKASYSRAYNFCYLGILCILVGLVYELASDYKSLLPEGEVTKGKTMKILSRWFQLGMILIQLYFLNKFDGPSTCAREASIKVNQQTKGFLYMVIPLFTILEVTRNPLIIIGLASTMVEQKVFALH